MFNNQNNCYCCGKYIKISIDILMKKSPVVYKCEFCQHYFCNSCISDTYSFKICLKCDYEINNDYQENNLCCF